MDIVCIINERKKPFLMEYLVSERGEEREGEREEGEREEQESNLILYRHVQYMYCYYRMKSTITFNDFDLIKAFQNLSVSSPAPVTIVCPSGDIACTSERIKIHKNTAINNNY